MLENEFRISELIGKHLRDELDILEEMELNAWLDQSAANRSLLESFTGESNLVDRIEMLNAPGEEAIWNKITGRLATQNRPQAPARKIRSFNFLHLAAAILTLIAVGVGIWFYKTRYDRQQQILVWNGISPGQKTATLRLSNGQTIRLTGKANGQLAEDAGISITKTTDGQLIYQTGTPPFKGQQTNSSTFNTLSTAKGETYQVRLPDGSSVWLNAASSLTYSPALLQQGKRSVKLDGEAYFEISKDKAHPFIVQAGNQQVEVLGTHFNVKAYNDERSVKTTLLEGSVKVTAKGVDRILKPEEQAILNAGSELAVQKVNGTDAIDWKNGEFIFHSESLQEIMRSVSRWYNVDIVYLGEVPQDTFTGTISRFDNISSVLTLLETTQKVQFEIQGKKLIVKK